MKQYYTFRVEYKLGTAIFSDDSMTLAESLADALWNVGRDAADNGDVIHSITVTDGLENE